MTPPAGTEPMYLNKQDLLSRLIAIDQTAPDIRTVEQELQRTIADIRAGKFDCPSAPPDSEPKHCDHECICWLIPEDAKRPCSNNGCDHDTRARGPVAQPGVATDFVIRPSVLLFAEAMERTLRIHDNKKDGWKDCGFHWLLDRVHDEVAEAEATRPGPYWELEAALELIDVANFCMMFYDNLTPCSSKEYNSPITIIATKEHDAAIRKEERERVLDTIMEWSTAMTAIHNFAEKTDYGWRMAMEQLREKIKYIRVSESLRSPSPESSGEADAKPTGTGGKQ